MTTKSAAIFWGIAFVAVGLLAFISNPIIDDSGNAIFHADTLHSVIHLASGALFLFVALGGTGATVGFLRVFGVVYLAIGIIGIIKMGSSGMGKLFGFLHLNAADNYLHVGLGLLILLSSFLKQSEVKRVN